MVEEQEGHEVRITLKQVWEAQQAQGKEIAGMSAKLDLYIGLNEGTKAIATDHETRLRSLETSPRITDLERRVWAFPGIAVIIALAGFVVSLYKL